MHKGMFQLAKTKLYCFKIVLDSAYNEYIIIVRLNEFNVRCMKNIPSTIMEKTFFFLFASTVAIYLAIIIKDVGVLVNSRVTLTQTLTSEKNTNSSAMYLKFPIVKYL